MRIPYWSVQKLVSGARCRARARASRARRARPGVRRPPSASPGTCAPTSRVERRGGIAGDEHVLERRCVRHGSTGTPRSHVSPLPRSQLTSASTPIPTTTWSAATTRPVESFSARTRRSPRRPSTVASVMTSTPSSRCMRANHAPELGPEHSRQRRRRGLDHRHLGAELAGAGGNLLADEAGAEHREPRPRAQRRRASARSHRRSAARRRSRGLRAAAACAAGCRSRSAASRSAGRVPSDSSTRRCAGSSPTAATPSSSSTSWLLVPLGRPERKLRGRACASVSRSLDSGGRSYGRWDSAQIILIGRSQPLRRSASAQRWAASPPPAITMPSAVFMVLMRPSFVAARKNIVGSS